MTRYTHDQRRRRPPTSIRWGVSGRGDRSGGHPRPGACRGGPRPPAARRNRSGAESSEIIVLPTPDSPLVTLRIGFRTGSVDDPAGKKNGPERADRAADGTRRHRVAALRGDHRGALSVVRVDPRAVRQGDDGIGRRGAPGSPGSRSSPSCATCWSHRASIESDFRPQPRLPDQHGRRDPARQRRRGAGQGGPERVAVRRASLRVAHRGGPRKGWPALTLDDVRAFHRDHYTRDRALSAWREATPTASSSGSSRSFSTLCRPTGPSARRCRRPGRSTDASCCWSTRTPSPRPSPSASPST